MREYATAKEYTFVVKVRFAEPTSKTRAMRHVREQFGGHHQRWCSSDGALDFHTLSIVPAQKDTSHD